MALRAAVLRAPRTIEIVDVPQPEPGRDEVRVRVEGCGLCGSNLPAWTGANPWQEYPLGPGAGGHEAWGIVEAVGDGVTTFAPGDRVAGLFQNAFAERDVAPASSCVPVPDALAGAPAPAEPVACAVNAFRRSDVRAGDTVAVVGVGFLGALIVKLAADAGARVIAITRREDALAHARRLGADVTIPYGDREKVRETVDAETDGALCDRVIECTGKQDPLDLSSEITTTRGRLVIVGYHQDGPREVNMQLWNWRGLDVVNAHERDPAVYVDGMREGLRLMAEGALPVRDLVTHDFPLHRLGDAYRTLETRPTGFMKAYVRCNNGQ